MDELLKHIDRSPLGLFDGRIIRHRSTTEEEVVAWLSQLFELAEKAKEMSHA